MPLATKKTCPRTGLPTFSGCVMCASYVPSEAEFDALVHEEAVRLAKSTLKNESTASAKDKKEETLVDPKTGKPRTMVVPETQMAHLMELAKSNVRRDYHNNYRACAQASAEQTRLAYDAEYCWKK